MRSDHALLVAVLICLGATVRVMGAAPATNSLGIFEGHGAIGQPAKAGEVRYYRDGDAYAVTGGGENMWFTNDAGYFIWKRISDNARLAANIAWPAPGGNPHRKACLMLRQSLAPDAPYADAVLHGDGLCSLQFREVAGGPTREIQANVKGPRRLQIEKVGNRVWMSISRDGEPLRPAGGSYLLALQDPFYAGLAVCAHDDRVTERAVFSKVELTSLPPLPTNAVLESTLETIDIYSMDRRVVYHARAHFEAPNWSPDDRYFLFNSGGRLYTLHRSGGTPVPLDTGFATRCNNDHGISPDGSQIAFSHHGPTGASLIYVIPAEGGDPRMVTMQGPSYWHGWSPESSTLVYCAERDGNYDIYSIPASGGIERRLTEATGLDDGPDYSPDGRHIYFNSERTGAMKIWRMLPDGRDETQITFDEHNDWFPHPSPDGQWLVFLSYAPGVKGHPANHEVELRLMKLAGGEIRVLAKLFGGQGTINVPSWSPDSRHLAFVSYRFAAP